MIILYIPFDSEQAGNLPDLAKMWKENYKPLLDNDEVKIIFYKEDFSVDLISYGSSVYVLGHGCNYLPKQIANNSDWENIELIDMVELGTRFNHDFLCIADRISEIHVYCCGSQKKNKGLAQELQKELISKEHSKISYYGGSVLTPNSEGKKFCRINKKLYSVESRKGTLQPDNIPPEKIRNTPKQSTTSLLVFANNQKFKDQLFASQKEKKEILYKALRNKYDVIEDKMDIVDNNLSYSKGVVQPKIMHSPEKKRLSLKQSTTSLLAFANKQKFKDQLFARQKEERENILQALRTKDDKMDIIDNNLSF